MSRLRLSAVVLISGIALAACGGSSSGGGDQVPGSGPLSGTTITLYNSQHEQTTRALINAFTAKTGVQVRVKDGDEDALTAQIEQEGSHSPADVFFTENSNWLQQLDDRHLLAHVDSSTLDNVPAGDSAPNGDWVGVSSRVSAIVYNPSKISPSQLPKSILDLAQPQWKGKIELAPAETDFWPVVASVARAKGDAAALAWLRGIKANAGSNANVPDNETLTSDVDKGTTGLGLINHYYYYRLRAEAGGPSKFDAKLAYFAPRDPGYVEAISGAGIMASTQHLAAAQAFLTFLTSDAGQRILATSDSYEYPIHPGIAASSEMPPLKDLKPNDFTPAELGTGLHAKDLMQEVGLL
ncbi:MAG TPA: extracellular solute-binding protein [Mycobacteriales bacterium]|nr:extracellular solute-binding protein [Mycobacteriales bacterium]